MSTRTASPRALELLAVTLVLALVGALAYGFYIAHGGFYRDDWSDLAGFRFGHSPRYWSDVADLHRGLGGRPMLALLLPIPDGLFGARTSLHLGLALALGIGVSLCVYLLLRTLSMAPVHALPIAVLALLFPWSDSDRLWGTASVTSVSVCFLCLGIVVALRGLRHRGAVGLAVHAAAEALYVLAILTYEATGAVALLAGLLYFRRAPAATAARRWLADVVVVLGALAYSLAATVSARHVGSLADRIGDVPHFARQAALLLAAAVVPNGRQTVPFQATLLIGVAVIAGLSVASRRRGSSEAAGGWLGWGTGALVAIAAAYFMFLGSHLHPLDPGIDNRMNVVAGPAYCVLVYAIVATLASLVFSSQRRASLVSVAAAVLIAAGYAVHLVDDQSAWKRAARLQHAVLTSLDHALPQLPRGSTLVTFGQRAQAAPGVPVFDTDYDLRGAVRLQKSDPALFAYPTFGSVAVRCNPANLLVAGPINYGTFRVGYRRLFFLDVARGKGRRISSAVDCRHYVER